MHRLVFIALLIIAFASVSCVTDPKPTQRTYRMGFGNSAPRYDDINLVIQTLNIWTLRADAAIVNTEVPWKELYDGMDPVTYVVNNYVGLVDFYRSKNLKLWVYIDPANGLDRAADALALQALGKSIAEPEVQAKYRRFVVVMDSILNPDHLGLALETNLIRVASPPAIYEGVKKAVNDVAAELAALNRPAPLSISVQVDVAWGNLGAGGFVGISQDFADFPFIEELGLSSYPYFGIDDPEELPINYYSKLIEGKSLPVFVSEGGWSSGSVSTPTASFTSSPEIQAQYVRRHKLLLDNVKATACFQLPFTDIDIASVPPPVPDNLGYFISIGMVDVNLQPKPALTAWDELFKTPLKAGN